MTINALCVGDVTCERGGRIVVSGISFDVARGEAIVLRGPNGSGKTTLLRTIAGFLRPASGSVALHREGIGRDNNATLVDHCHYFGHSNAVKPRLTVLENVRFWQRFYASPGGRDDAEAALDAFGLLDLADFFAGHLSQGQSRRLGLARLAVSSRAVWLMDEPSASLDAASTALLEAQLAAHLDQGGLAVVSTHGELRLANAREVTLGRNPRANMQAFI